MIVRARIDKDFVPFTKRPILRRNAGLFVDGSGRGRGGARVLAQTGECTGPQDNGKACGPNGAGRCTPLGTCQL
jgi:hypothetical protein